MLKRFVLNLSYIIRHKRHVFQAGLKTKAPIWRLVIHDWSKLTVKEWRAYSNFFYGKHTVRPAGANGPKDIQVPAHVRDDFNRAWLSHIHRSPHHHQHWRLVNDNGEIIPLEMPEHFVREMVADWAGAGRAITGKWEVRQWYAKNSHLMELHPNTRQRVEELLEIFA